MNKNKTAIALILMFAMAVSFFALPDATAQEVGDKKTYPYIGAIPIPVGVGQDLLLHVGITDALGGQQYGWEGLTVTVTKPDGTTETISGIRTDATGGTGVVYVPTMVGNYTFQTHFPEQEMPVTSRGVPTGTVMLESDSDKLVVPVQEEPAPYHPGVPLSTEYWTRPIDQQAREWYTISANWLYVPRYKYAPYNDGPETAHILWVKPLTTGGIAGGALGDAASDALGYHGMECGDAYEGKFGGRVRGWGSAGPIIMAGKIYYMSGPYEYPRLYHCVDLHTGEELWAKTFLDNRSISFGQLFYWDSYNYHGVFDYLWVTVGGGRTGLPESWYAFDGFTGDWMFTIKNVPSGTTRWGENGEIYRFQVDLKNGWMALWNMSAFGTMQGSGYQAGGSWGACVSLKTLDAAANTTAANMAWSWNVTIPTDLSGSVRDIFFGDMILGASTTQTEIASWGLNLNSSNGVIGRVLFEETWDAPSEWAAGNVSISLEAITPDTTEDRVFVVYARELRQFYGFSAETGKFLWETEPEHYLNTYVGTECTIAYGKFISTGVSGITYCYDAYTGKLLWEYHATDPYQEILWANDWWTKPMFVTDGKIYLAHMEHSSIDPKPRGAPFLCLDMETGEEIWRANGLFRQTYWGSNVIIGDSVIVTMDTYDQRVYAIAKGPSATTVTASPEVSVHGSSVLVKGMVTDVSPGTEEYALRARFPNGVPAVADENMSDWMLYVYKQFARPADVIGVEVVVEVLDPNNNYYEVGRVTSDASGYFGSEFVPEVPGLYKIIASFEGSEAYYGSFAETFINVEEAPVATPEPTPTPASVADMYLVPGIIGIIVAIAVVGAILVLMLRKR
jgi:outer membrane protein assembly factor BamB